MQLSGVNRCQIKTGGKGKKELRVKTSEQGRGIVKKITLMFSYIG